MKKIYLRITTAFLFLMLAAPAFAQTGFDDDVDDEPQEEDPQAPIDDHIPVAIAGALVVAYAVVRKQNSHVSS